MMKNLLTYLQYEHREEILLYFTDTAKEEVQGDKQDKENKLIIYATDKYLEEKDFDDIGFLEVVGFFAL